MVLGRTRKQLWNFTRTLVTQIVEHQRIQTTQAKAKIVNKHLERVIINAKRSTQGINAGTNILKNILTTNLAFKKATLQLAERFKDQKHHFTRISSVKGRRRGDHAPLVNIQIRGNEFQKTERAAFQQQKKSDNIANLKNWKKNFVMQRKQLIENKLKENQNQLSQQQKKQFEKVLANFDLQLKLMNREKYEKIQFVPYS